MNPLSLKFKEQKSSENIDYSSIRYDESLNLSVGRETGLPAVDYLSLEMDTTTRKNGEESDAGFENRIDLIFGTDTYTLDAGEGSDDDNDIRSIKLLMKLDTITESDEDTDEE